jgi:hypothetical protein
MYLEYICVERERAAPGRGWKERLSYPGHFPLFFSFRVERERERAREREGVWGQARGKARQSKAI